MASPREQHSQQEQLWHDEESHPQPTTKIEKKSRFNEDEFRKSFKKEHDSLWKELCITRDTYKDEQVLLMLARVAESAEDFKTMQTYVRRFVDLRIDNTKGSTSINDDKADKVRVHY
jgi:hypothetical protein